MARAPFAFASDSFDRNEYPDEIVPAAGSDRFPFTVPKAKLGEGRPSKLAELFAERVAEFAGSDPADIPLGLLHAIEAADGWTEENVKNLAHGRSRSISTEVGDIWYVDFFANPMPLVHDPNNGRTTAEARAKGYPYLELVADDEVTGAPIMVVEDAAQFLEGVETATRALGFTGTISDTKDVQDINWIGLQGVHEAALTSPTLVRDAAGNSTWILKQDDGNRRLAMVRRVLREATNLPATEVEAWADHLHASDGGARLADWTAVDVERVRRKSGFGNPKYYRPANASAAAIDEWLEQATTAQRTVIRTSVMPIRLVVGYRPRGQQPAGQSTSVEAVHRYIRRTHIQSAAQREWSQPTQMIQVALDTIRRVRTNAERVHGYTMVLTRNELDVVYRNDTPDWQGTDDPDDPQHPLRLAAKAIAMFVCSGTDAEKEVRQSLIAHAMPTHHTKIREHRAGVAASVAMPILGLTVADKGEYNRARATVDRASRHPMFSAVTRHPDGETDPWWAYLGEPVDELAARAVEEFNDGAGRGDTLDEKSVGNFGPATRALLFLATIGQATNPGFAAEEGEQVSPFQLTVNGLGGTRGNTLTTPDLVMRQVLARHGVDGVTQLAAIITAALAGEEPVNTLVPDYVDVDDNGTADERTRGKVTERFLRGEVMGWPSRAGGDPTPPGAPAPRVPIGPDGQLAPMPKPDPFTQALDQLTSAIQVAAASIRPFLDDPEVSDPFRESGLPERDTARMIKQTTRIMRLLQRGELIAASRGGNLLDDDEDDE